MEGLYAYYTTLKVPDFRIRSLQSLKLKFKSLLVSPKVTLGHFTCTQQQGLLGCGFCTLPRHTGQNNVSGHDTGPSNDTL